MNSPLMDDRETAPLGRLMEVAVGLAITVAPLAALAAVQLALVPHSISTIEGLSNHERAWSVSLLRRDWLAFYSVATAIVAVHWVTAAALAKKPFVRLRKANLTLALFIFAIAAFSAYGAFMDWPERMKGLCPLLGISDNYASGFGFDMESSCDTFAQNTHMIISLGLLGLTLMLIIASTIFRIGSSRRAPS